MREFEQIVFLHLGQAGLQMSSSFWELICIEHGISPDGVSFYSENESSEFENIASLFDRTNVKTYVPRSILIDSEPNVIEEIKTGAYRGLFRLEMMITGTEDASNNYARGAYTIGRRLLGNISDNIRKISENTDNLRGFFIFNSTGGGTGSALAALISLTLTRDYPKITRSAFSITPGNNYSSAIVEPYNMVLQNLTYLETMDINYLFETESFYNICCTKLLLLSPTFSDINRIVAMMLSSITNSIRFTSTIQSTLNDIMTNLIPYPRIHYPIVRYAPLNHTSKVCYDNISTTDLTKELFSKNNQSVNIDTNRGLFISLVLNCQGLINTHEVYRTIEQHKTNNSSKFVEWSPTSFKVGICNQIPAVSPMIQIASTDKAATILINTTAISQFFISQTRKFDNLFRKRSFLHWYFSEGMEEIEFIEAKDDIHLLVGDFKEIGLSERQIMEHMNKEHTSQSSELY